MKRSKFSLSHQKIGTGDMGMAIPVGLVEVLPGDSFQHSTSVLMRLSPLLSPVMHKVRVKVEHVFVPTRIVWEDAEDFFTGGADGLQAPTFPTMAFTGANQAAIGSLADWFGVPTGEDCTVSAIPFRMYAAWWNDRVQNRLVQSPQTISLASGADVTTNRDLLASNWQNDPFTAAHPEQQLGPGVDIPIGTDAPVVRVPGTGNSVFVHRTDTGALFGNAGNPQTGAGGDLVFVDGGGNKNVNFDPNGSLLADLSAVTGIPLELLRQSAALQKFFEAQMIHGSRYRELLAQWGVRYSDARLQLPEHLASSQVSVQFSEVLQTGVTTDGDPDEGVGNLRGHGIAAMKSNAYRKTFEEHGYVMTILTVLPETLYAQGIPAHLLRFTKEKHYIPQFAHVGEELIPIKELYAGAADPELKFGYRPRYDTYRRVPNSIHGQFRDTLDFWHFGRLFASEPALNSDFVTADPTKRPFQVTSEDVLWMQINHSLQARRIVASDSTPGMTI